MDIITDLRVEILALERIKSFDPSQAITHEDMLKKLEKED
jgi:hypothetical protein